VVSDVLAQASTGFSEQEITTTKKFLRQFLANMREKRRGTHG
jgi:hypothetical protein